MNPKEIKKESATPEDNKENKDLVFNNGVYVAKKKISAGSFGTVYTGVDTTNNEEVALKLEKIEEEDMRSLQRESQILTRLQGIKGIPKLYWYGNKGNHDVIVITLLGRDLGSFLKIYKKFSLKTVLMIGDQLLNVLQEIHTKSVVHRDIKPENIIMGRGETKNTVFLVDYGISKIFRDSQNKHIPYREKKSFIGTTRYASIAAHMGVEVARKDDLESLIYVLIYLAKGQLPWQNLNVSEKEKTKKVGDMKLKYTSEELCKDLPEEFATYLNYVKGLNFKQNPDYDFVRKLLRDLAATKNIDLDNAWDWTMPLSLKNTAPASGAGGSSSNINLQSPNKDGNPNKQNVGEFKGRDPRQKISINLIQDTNLKKQMDKKQDNFNFVSKELSPSPHGHARGFLSSSMLPGGEDDLNGSSYLVVPNGVIGRADSNSQYSGVDKSIGTGHNVRYDHSYGGGSMILDNVEFEVQDEDSKEQNGHRTISDMIKELERNKVKVSFKKFNRK